jgi:predicted nucleic acid-binding protein
LNDEPGQHAEARELFRGAAKGEYRLLASELLFAEVIWVLVQSPAYRLDRKVIATRLRLLLEQPEIEAVHGNQTELVRALQTFGDSSLDLMDCLVIAVAEQSGHSIATFDRALRKATSAPCWEPA